MNMNTQSVLLHQRALKPALLCAGCSSIWNVLATAESEAQGSTTM